MMKESITKYYGVNLDDSYNRAITDAWDNAQERVRFSRLHVSPGFNPEMSHVNFPAFWRPPSEVEQ